MAIRWLLYILLIRKETKNVKDFNIKRSNKICLAQDFRVES